MSWTHEDQAHYDAYCRASLANVQMGLAPQPRRNDPCPCGANRKWKHCHGDPARKNKPYQKEPTT